MNIIKNLFLVLTLLLAFTYRVTAGPTAQVRDGVIYNGLVYKLDTPLLFQLDTITYNAIAEKLDFKSAVFSWNFRGHVATFEATVDKLYLKSIRTLSEQKDFKGLLDTYMNKDSEVFASWVSGTFVCGRGECIYESSNGFDSVYENEIQLEVKDGVITSTRSFTNKCQGNITLEDVKSKITSDINLSKIPEVKGRVTVKINASEFNVEGKVTGWNVDFLSGHENLPHQTKQMIIAEVNRVFNQYDWKTHQRDGIWHWSVEPIIFPLIFKQ